MSEVIQSLKKRSDELLLQPRDGDDVENTVVQVRIDEGSPIPVFLGRNVQSNALLIRIGPFDYHGLTIIGNLPDVAGLSVKVDYQEQRPSEKAWLRLQLQDVSCEDVFLLFVARVIEILAESDSESSAISVVLSLIDRWKLFFSTANLLLSRERQIGLYGELDFIVKAATAGAAIDAIVRAWSGPRRANQDFEFGKVAVEVKASVGVDKAIFSVSNIRQLDTSGLDRLFVCHLVLDRRSAGDMTLLEKVSQVRNLVSTSNAHVSTLFEEKLLEYGYRDEHALNYRESGYCERAVNVYWIQPGFPCLVEKTIPEGVINATYKVSTVGCNRFKTSIVDIVDAVRIYD